MPPGVRSSLTVKLHSAASHDDRGKYSQAVQLLNTLTNQVDSLRSDAVLTAEQAANLTGAASTVIETHRTS